MFGSKVFCCCKGVVQVDFNPYTLLSWHTDSDVQSQYIAVTGEWYMLPATYNISLLSYLLTSILSKLHTYVA